MAMLIPFQRSVIPACDVATLEHLDALVQATHDLSHVGAYKIGLELALPFGLPGVVSTIRSRTNLPIIYDHQKGGTDIPDLGERFARCCKDAGVDAVILFPLSGPEVLSSWLQACREQDVDVVVGGEMTHPRYLAEEGGYIAGDAPLRIYSYASELSVTRFVVPGTKPERIREYRQALGDKAEFFSPGLVTQGGSITEAGAAAGSHWHAIVGRAIYDAHDMREAAKRMVSALTQEGDVNE